MSGRLEVICGPMLSGKSEELIRRLTRAKIAGSKITAIKPNIDTRYDKDNIVSHAGGKWQSYGVQTDRPQDIKSYAIWPDIIAIDEVQFFNSGIVRVIMEMVEGDKVVIVTGLDMDYKGVPFGSVPELMARADTVTKLSAVCTQCGADAMMTQRLRVEGPTILVGGTESYDARCRSCHIS